MQSEIVPHDHLAVQFDPAFSSMKLPKDFRRGVLVFSAASMLKVLLFLLRGARHADLI